MSFSPCCPGELYGRWHRHRPDASLYRAPGAGATILLRLPLLMLPPYGIPRDAALSSHRRWVPHCPLLERQRETKIRSGTTMEQRRVESAPTLNFSKSGGPAFIRAEPRSSGGHGVSRSVGSAQRCVYIHSPPLSYDPLRTAGDARCWWRHPGCATECSQQHGITDGASVL
jgi:hypothetical protein